MEEQRALVKEREAAVEAERLRLEAEESAAALYKEKQGVPKGAGSRLPEPRDSSPDSPAPSTRAPCLSCVLLSCWAGMWTMREFVIL